MNQSEKPPKPAKNKYQCPKATAPQRHRDTKKNHTRARAQRSGYRNRHRHRNLTLIKNISRKELEKKNVILRRGVRRDRGIQGDVYLFSCCSLRIFSATLLGTSI
jgi:hypothetical protein